MNSSGPRGLAEKVTSEWPMRTNEPPSGLIRNHFTGKEKRAWQNVPEKGRTPAVSVV